MTSYVLGKSAVKLQHYLVAIAIYCGHVVCFPYLVGDGPATSLRNKKKTENLKQDKSSDIQRQPPYGDQQQSNTLPQMKELATRPMGTSYGCFGKLSLIRDAYNIDNIDKSPIIIHVY